MKTEEHFIALYRHYRSDKIVTTNEELADVLACSVRHTRVLIKSFVESGWINWESQRGRGRRSTLTFLRHPLDVSKYYIRKMMLEGNVQVAVQSIKEFDLLEHERTTLYNDIRALLGVQSSLTEDKQTRDRLVLEVPETIQHVEPLHVITELEEMISRHIYECLVTYNYETKSYEPHLVYGFEQMDRMWTFYLRKGIFFHNGEELFATHVANHFQTLSLNDPYAIIQKVECIDSYTVRFHLSEENHLFLAMLASQQAAVTITSQTQKMIGTGPLQLHDSTTDTYKLVPFSSYFKGRSFIDEITLVHLPSVRTNAMHQKSNRLQHGFSGLFFRSGSPNLPTSLQKYVCEVIDSNAMIDSLQGPRALPVLSSHALRSSEPDSEYSATFTIGTLDYPLYVDDLRWIRDQLSSYNITVNIHLIATEDIETALSEIDAFYGGLQFTEGEDGAMLQLLQEQTNPLLPYLETNVKEALKTHQKNAQQSSHTSKRKAFYQAMLEELAESYSVCFTYVQWDQDYPSYGLEDLFSPSLRRLDFHRCWCKQETRSTRVTIL